MTSNDEGAREKIFKAACELIADGTRIENVTMRQIAEKAGVNLALINYYYQSKENLLSMAVASRMDGIIRQMGRRTDSDEDPVTALKNMFLSTADFAFAYHDYWKIAAATDVKQGCRNACEIFIPLLKEIFRDKDEMELKITALQIILPFYNIVLHTGVYNDFLKTDFFDARQRSDKIKQMIDNMILSENKNRTGGSN